MGSDAVFVPVGDSHRLVAPAIVIAAIFGVFFTRGLSGAGYQVFPDQEAHGKGEDQICNDMLKQGHFILKFDKRATR
jgi:hypothetical protein